MTVPYAVDSDPLNLGTGYECIRVDPNNEVNFNDIFAQSGTFLQGDAAVRLNTLTVEYYLHDGTVLDSGTTQNGWMITAVGGPKKGNQEHETMTVQCRRHEAVDLVDTVTGSALHT